MLCWGGFGAWSVYTLLFGAAFGAVTTLRGVTNIAALNCGPMSYTSVIISFFTLISALSGVLFFGETLGWAQIVGMVLMLASFVLAAKSDGKGKRSNGKWLVLCLVAFLATGGIGLMQKVHQGSAHRDELNAFLITAFISASVFCSAVVYVLKKRAGRSAQTADQAPRRPYLLLLIMLISGFCVAANHRFNLYLSGIMNSAVFFPIVNGGGLVLTTIAAVTVFRERLVKKQWVGLILGIASVVFLCDPFS